MAKQKKTFKEILDDVKNIEKEADPLAALEGSNIIKLPFRYWKKNMFFWGGCDHQLRKYTGCFPATLKQNKSTHPVFLLHQNGNHSFKACPCTSQYTPFAQYIKSNCSMQMTRKKLDRDSYILKNYSFNLSHDLSFQERLRFAGLVPEKCLVKNDSH